MWALLSPNASPGAAEQCVGLEDWEVEPFCSLQRVSFSLSLSLSLSRLCIGSACSMHGSSEWNRQGVLTDPGVNCIFYLGCPGKEHQEGRTAPVPWASSAASLSPEMRKKSVSMVCTVQNPECLTVLYGCLLGVVLFFFLWERAE